MNTHLRTAIENVLHEAHACSVDTNGYVQYMSAQALANLLIEYNKECRKHGKGKCVPKG